MFTSVPAHINQLACLFYSQECSINYCFRVSNKSNHRPVGGSARIYIEQADSIYRSNLFGNPVNNGKIIAFAEVGYTFDDGLHALEFGR